LCRSFITRNVCACMVCIWIRWWDVVNMMWSLVRGVTSNIVAMHLNNYDECHQLLWVFAMVYCCCAHISSQRPSVHLILVSGSANCVFRTWCHLGRGRLVCDIQYRIYEHQWFRWNSSVMMSCYNDIFLLPRLFITRTVCACVVDISNRWFSTCHQRIQTLIPSAYTYCVIKGQNNNKISVEQHMNNENCHHNYRCS